MYIKTNNTISDVILTFDYTYPNVYPFLGDTVDSTRRDNYFSFSKDLFGSDWNQKEELVIDIYNLLYKLCKDKDEEFTGTGLNKTYFSSYKKYGVNLFLAGVTKQYAKQLVKKLKFINSKYNDEYFIHSVTLMVPDRWDGPDFLEVEDSFIVFEK